jgi:hypothetical protein
MVDLKVSCLKLPDKSESHEPILFLEGRALA